MYGSWLLACSCTEGKYSLTHSLPPTQFNCYVVQYWFSYWVATIGNTCIVTISGLLNRRIIHQHQVETAPPYYYPSPPNRSRSRRWPTTIDYRRTHLTPTASNPNPNAHMATHGIIMRQVKIAALADYRTSCDVRRAGVWSTVSSEGWATHGALPHYCHTVRLPLGALLISGAPCVATGELGDSRRS